MEILIRKGHRKILQDQKKMILLKNKFLKSTMKKFQLNLLITRIIRKNCLLLVQQAFLFKIYHQ